MHRIREHKLALTLLAAALTTVALALLIRLPYSGNGGPASVTVEERDGVYDLTGIAENTVALLPPGPTYYPGVLLTPENAHSAEPEGTGRYDALRADYLSQRFVVQLPDTGSDQVYALTFQVSGRHAMRVYVNGLLAGQSGKPGTTKRDTEIWENRMTCYGAAKDGRMEILLQSAQFYHYKSGARLATLRLQAAAAYHDGLIGPIKGVLTMGALACAAALLLCIYLLLQRTRATLYFAVACLAMMIRECIQSQAWMYFPFISSDASFLLEYLSVALLTIFLSLYLGQYAANPFLRVAQYTAIIGSALYGLFVLFGDSVFYTSATPYYQVLLVVSIVPGITGLFWTMRRPTGEQAAALYGIAVFYVAAVYDILMYSDLFGDALRNVPISEGAMLIFMLAQTVSLFLMNGRLFAQAKDAERKLAAEKEALEKLDRLKTQFLANVSHELKTPLTVVSGHAQMVRTQLSGAENRIAWEKLSIIAAEADRLALMVGQFLDVTRIEEGRMALDRRPCHVDELIYRAVETHFPILNQNGNRLEIKVDPDLPAVCVDGGRITQVLVNLIANAVRHTMQGVITVAARREDNLVKVSVADTGAGIVPQELPNLFTRFHTHGAKGNGTGTGLGLYICKHIMEEHGGKILVDSSPGVGTTITLLLALEP